MRRLVLLITVVSSVLGACGDDDDSDGSAAITTTTTSAVATSTTAAATTLRCETVGFTPNSEDAASDITATGLSCSEAEAFVRVAGTRTSSGGPQEVTVSGYRCVRTRSEQDPLPRAFYECVSGSKTVTFVRS